MSKLKHEEIKKMSDEFYDLFENNYDLNKDLSQHGLNQIYIFDCDKNDCKLTFEEWCLKHEHIYEPKTKI